MPSHRFPRLQLRCVAAFAACCAGLTLASGAAAVDLRDWGRKFPTAERFVVLSQFGSQAVLDKETQLVWQRDANLGGNAWELSKNACLALKLGGRRGWRLPSVHELQSLANADAPIGVLALPAGHPFINVQLAAYWSATRVVLISGEPSGAVYSVLFNAGGAAAFSLPDMGRRIWCVRGGGPISEH